MTVCPLRCYSWCVNPHIVIVVVIVILAVAEPLSPTKHTKSLVTDRSVFSIKGHTYRKKSQTRMINEPVMFSQAQQSLCV